MMPVCPKCGKEKPTDLFAKRKNGVVCWCLECNAASTRKWYTNNKAKSRKNGERFRENNPEKTLEYKEKAHAKSFGMTVEEVAKLKEHQKNCCAVCGRPLTRTAIDHDHKTGETRGVLCWLCNLGIASLRESIATLEKAIAYLTKTPVVVLFGEKKYALPGRVTASRKTRRALAKKAIQLGLVGSSAYTVSCPDLLKDR